MSLSQPGTIQKDYQAVNRALKVILDFYKAPTYQLIKHLQREHDYTLEQIGEIIGMSKQGVQIQYINKLEAKK